MLDRAATLLSAVACASTATILTTSLARAADPNLPPEVGYDYGEFAQPRGAALGGAVRAFSNSLDALYANPANLAATHVYHLGGAAQFWPQAGRSSYGGGVVDSVTNKVAAGVGGQYLLTSTDNLDRNGVDARLALSFPVGDRLLFGVAGRYLMLKQDAEGPLGESAASSGIPDRHIVKAFTFDAGATLRPTKGLALSAVGYNLTNPDHGFLPLTAGGGVGFGTEDFTLEADVVGDFRTWDRATLRAMSGFEFLAADHYPLRLGYRFDQGAESHAVCAGIGYLEQAFSASVSVRQVVEGDVATAVFLGFEYHLEASTSAPAEGF